MRNLSLFRFEKNAYKASSAKSQRGGPPSGRGPPARPYYIEEKAPSAMRSGTGHERGERPLKSAPERKNINLFFWRKRPFPERRGGAELSGSRQKKDEKRGCKKGKTPPMSFLEKKGKGYSRRSPGPEGKEREGRRLLQAEDHGQTLRKKETVSSSLPDGKKGTPNPAHLNRGPKRT